MFSDPEDTIEDEMIQCIVCEDWFHCRHLQTKVPKSNSFSEMICGDCMVRNEFLYHYVGMSIAVVEDTELDTTINTDTSLNVTDKHDVTIDESADKQSDEKVEELLKDEINQSIMNIIEINKSNTESNDKLDDPPAKKQKLDTESVTTTSCKKPVLVGEKVTGATFWPSDWRKNICTCAKCLMEMKELQVEFLADLEDTILSYQEKGLAKVHETSEERAMRAFSKIDRCQQINVLTGYNKLKEKLKEFLREYAVSDVAVTIDDVNRFFRMMNEQNEK